MREKEPQFTVTDRRKFTSEGELREGESQLSESVPAPAAAKPVASAAPVVTPGVTPGVESGVESGVEAIAGPLGDEPDLGDEEDMMPEPTAAEAAQQNKDYAASASRLDAMVASANPGQPGPLAMNFDRLVQSLYMTAAMQMGAGTASHEQPRIDILGARQSIDMLLVLEEKTKGNLSAEEQRLLANALFDLRMSFLEITNAIANSAQRPPKAGKLH